MKLIVAFLLLSTQAFADTACNQKTLDDLRAFADCRGAGNIYACSAMNPGALSGAIPFDKKYAHEGKFKMQMLPLDLRDEKLKKMKEVSAQTLTALEGLTASIVTPTLVASIATGGAQAKEVVQARKAFAQNAPQLGEMVWDNILYPTAKEIGRTHSHEVTKQLIKKMLVQNVSRLMAHAGERIMLPILTMADTDIVSSELVDMFAKVGLKGAWAAPVIGGVVSVVFSATPTGCGTNFDFYINRDVNNNCQEVYDIDSHVIEFLSLPPAEEDKMLKDPQMCNFITKLHQNLLEKPVTVKRLSCQRNRATFEITDGASNPGQIYQVTATQGAPMNAPLHGRIRQITHYAGSGGNLFINPDGRISNYDTGQYIQHAFEKIQLNLDDVVNCCDTKDDAVHQKCMSTLNSAKDPDVAWDAVVGDSSASR